TMTGDIAGRPVGGAVRSIKHWGPALRHRRPSTCSCTTRPAAPAKQVDHEIALSPRPYHHRGQRPHPQELGLPALLIGFPVVSYLDRVEVIEAEPGGDPGGELRLAGDEAAESGVKTPILIGAEKKKLILR